MKNNNKFKNKVMRCWIMDKDTLIKNYLYEDLKKIDLIKKKKQIRESLHCMITSLPDKPKALKVLGSFVKDTYLSSSDIDIGVIYDSNYPKSLKKIYHNTHKVVKKCSKSVRRNNPAIKINPKENLIDIIPGKESSSNNGNVNIDLSREKRRKVTNFEKQIKSVNECNCNDEIRFIKKILEENKVKIPSFSLERAIIKCNENIDSETPLNGKIEQISKCLLKINRTEIYDPANLSNDISSQNKISKTQWSRFKKITSRINEKFKQNQFCDLFNEDYSNMCKINYD